MEKEIDLEKLEAGIPSDEKLTEGIKKARDDAENFAETARNFQKNPKQMLIDLGYSEEDLKLGQLRLEGEKVDYSVFFEEGKVYKCNFVFDEGTSVQIFCDGVLPEVLGIAKNFIFPERPNFTQLVKSGFKGRCKIMLNPERPGLLAYEIRVKIPHEKIVLGED